MAESFKQEVSLIQRTEMDGIKLKQPKHDSEPIHNTIGWAEQNQTSAPKASRTVVSETIVKDNCTLLQPKQFQSAR